MYYPRLRVSALVVITIAGMASVAVAVSLRAGAKNISFKRRASEGGSERVVLNPNIIKQGDEYVVKLPVDYTGDFIEVRHRRCDFINRANCVTPKLNRHWSQRFVNGVARISTKDTVPLGIWYLEFRIPGETAFMRPVTLTVVSTKANEEYVSQQTRRLIRRFNASFPLENMPLPENSLGVSTIGQLERRFAGDNRLDLADKRATALLPQKPSVTPPASQGQQYESWLNSWATWRKKASARHLIFADYYALRVLTGGSGGRERFDKGKVADHVYQAVTQLDILVSLPKHRRTISGLPQPRFLLGETQVSQRYLADISSGVLKGLFWIESAGLVPQTYCTKYERPYDRGKGCKTINLRDRLADVASAVVASTATKWVYKPDGTLRKDYGDYATWYQGAFQSGDPYMDYVPGNRSRVKDFLGRSYSLNHPLTQNGNPHFYSWQMAGLSAGVRLALTKGGISETQRSQYSSLLSWATSAVAYEFSYDIRNRYGYQMFGKVNHSCDGDIVRDCSSGVCYDDCVGGSKELYAEWMLPYDMPYLIGNSWQHLGTVLASWGWTRHLPSDYLRTKQNHFLTFHNTMWKDGHPLVDVDSDSYDGDLIAQLFPGRVCSCADNGSNSCFFYKDQSSGLTITKVAEFPHDYIFSVASAYYALMRAHGDTAGGLEALELLRITLDGMLRTTPDFSLAGCGDAPQFSSANTVIGAVTRTTAFIWQTLYGVFNDL